MNRIKVEPCVFLVEDALESLATNQEANIDLFGQQENDEVTERLNEELENINIDDSFVDEEYVLSVISKKSKLQIHEKEQLSKLKRGGIVTFRNDNKEEQLAETIIDNIEKGNKRKVLSYYITLTYNSSQIAAINR